MMEAYKNKACVAVQSLVAIASTEVAVAHSSNSRSQVATEQSSAAAMQLLGTIGPVMEAAAARSAVGGAILPCMQQCRGRRPCLVDRRAG